MLYYIIRSWIVNISLQIAETSKKNYLFIGLVALTATAGLPYGTFW